MKIELEALGAKNWLKVCSLSVMPEQKRVFPIPNVYWIGISRYEEHTDLFAVKTDGEYAGLIGLGYDEEGVSGLINPLMVDRAFQRRGIAAQALRLAAALLLEQYGVRVIHIGHRRENGAAGRLYERLGFAVSGGTDTEVFRTLRREENADANCGL